MGQRLLKVLDRVLGPSMLPRPLLDGRDVGPRGKTTERRGLLARQEFVPGAPSIPVVRTRGRPPSRGLPTRFKEHPRLEGSSEYLFPRRDIPGAGSVDFFKSGAGGRFNEGTVLHALMADTLQRDWPSTPELPRPIKDMFEVEHKAIKDAFEARAAWFGLPEVKDAHVVAVMDEAGFDPVPKQRPPGIPPVTWVRRVVGALPRELPGTSGAAPGSEIIRLGPETTQTRR